MSLTTHEFNWTYEEDPFFDKGNICHYYKIVSPDGKIVVWLESTGPLDIGRKRLVSVKLHEVALIPVASKHVDC
jgi:hypothetical protein